MNLHSTMFLLIRFDWLYDDSDPEFTFHYVSTYTKSGSTVWQLEGNLHSTMFLLIRNLFPRVFLSLNIYIPLCFYLYRNGLRSEYGFQVIYIPLCFYLYIKRRLHSWSSTNLHSTMFLLIPMKKVSCIGLSILFTFHYVSTYTVENPGFPYVWKEFTFHYVSTYTPCGGRASQPDPDLHSTMFLLIPSP